MTIRNQEELKDMVRVGRLMRTALAEMTRGVAVGVSTHELDDMCAEVFDRYRV